MSSRAARSSSSRLRSTASAASLRFDRARVGGVDEGEPSRRVARPHRRRQRFDQVRSDATSVSSLLMAPAEIEQLALDAARILEAEHGAAADGAALRPRSAGRRASSASSQTLRRARAGPRPHVPSRAPCRHRASCRRRARGAARRRRRCAGSPSMRRLVRRRRPVHHDLRLRQQQRVGAVELGAQCRDLVATGPQLPGAPRARARAAA